MSTRSTVALPLDNGFQGRYVHQDGYPEGMGVTLLKLIKQHGLETVRRVLIEEHYGWSSVNPSTTKDSPNYLDKRADLVPGWGLAYSDRKLTTPPFGTKAKPFQQVTADEWCRHDNDPDVAYVYVLNEGHVSVLEHSGKAVWKHLGDLPYDAHVTSENVQELLARSLKDNLAANLDKVVAEPTTGKGLVVRS